MAEAPQKREFPGLLATDLAQPSGAPVCVYSRKRGNPHRPKPGRALFLDRAGHARCIKLIKLEAKI